MVYQKMIQYQSITQVFKPRNESNLVTYCLNYLRDALERKEILWYGRLNSGLIKGFRGCIAGTSDIALIDAQGMMLWAECKMPKKKQSVIQREFENTVVKYPWFYYKVVYEVDDIKEWVERCPSLQSQA